MLGVEVNFRDAARLGLDDHNVNSCVILPACEVLPYLIPRYCFSESFTKHQYTEAKKFLADLGDAMVRVSGCGIRAGDYWVAPYLISEFEFEALEKLRRLWTEEKHQAAERHYG